MKKTGRSQSDRTSTEGQGMQPVVIAGCGESISSLSEGEKAFINRCDTVIGINKFMAFADVAGIWPSHAFFADFWSLACDVYIQLMFDLCRREGVTDVTFVLNRKLSTFRRTRVGRATVLVNRHVAGSPWASRERVAAIGRRLGGAGSFRSALGEMRKAAASRARTRIGAADGSETEAVNPRLSALVLPPGCHYEHVRCEGRQWASSLDEDLFHHRGSLTSAINYAAIVWPGREILLVGTDFYSSRYFFEDSETYRRARVHDWTTELAVAADRHYGTIEHDDTTIFDAFPLIDQELGKVGSKLYCANRRSLLVEKGCVDFRSIESFNTGAV